MVSDPQLLSPNPAPQQPLTIRCCARRLPSSGFPPEAEGPGRADGGSTIWYGHGGTSCKVGGGAGLLSAFMAHGTAWRTPQQDMMIRNLTDLMLIADRGHLLL